MNVALGSPLFLSALAIGIAVVGVYIFHRRPREEPVSSLMLWQGLIQPGGAGRQRETLKAPWLLALELLMVALLALAAAVPLLTAQTSGRSLIVVLDDSMSMQATATDWRSARERAREELEAVLGRYSPRRAAFILAADTPGLLGMNFESKAQADEALEPWTAQSGSADLLGAIRLGLNLATGGTDIVVLTDHAPPADIDLGPRVRWIALGSPADNVGFTSAARSASGPPACVVELTNYTGQPASRTIMIERDGAEPQSQSVTIAAGQTSRFRLPIDAEAEVTLRLEPPDALVADDIITLVPEDTRPVAIVIRAENQNLQNAAQRWIEADPEVVLATVSPPELLITDDTAPAPSGAWAFRVLAPESEANAYSGPLILNREHELAEGLDLSGLIWATDLDSPLPESQEALGARIDPLLVLASTTVIEHRRFASGGRETLLSLAIDASNLGDHIVWPVLLSNAARQRRAARPGPVTTNTRIGQPVRIATPSNSVDPIIVTDPTGETRTLRLRETEYTPLQPGRYTVAIGRHTYPLSVLSIAPSESDLREAETLVVEPTQIEGVESAATTRNIAWLLALLATTALIAHGLLVLGIYRRGGSV
ncbi:MAG: VWA domain-containing protein [Phycisphaerales bacterium JB050]